MAEKVYYAEYEGNLFRGEDNDGDPFYNEVLRKDGWDSYGDPYKILAYGSPISEKKAETYAKENGLGLDGEKL